MARLGVVYLIAAVLVVVVAVPLLLGRVPMNRWYGVRVPEAFASDENWYAINRYGAKWLLVFAGALAVLGGVCFVLRPQQSGVVLTAIVFAPVLFLVPVLVAILRFARGLPSG